MLGLLPNKYKITWNCDIGKPVLANRKCKTYKLTNKEPVKDSVANIPENCTFSILSLTALWGLKSPYLMA
jgi:hypothetical protein